MGLWFHTLQFLTVVSNHSMPLVCVTFALVSVPEAEEMKKKESWAS